MWQGHTTPHRLDVPDCNGTAGGSVLLKTNKWKQIQFRAKIKLWSHTEKEKTRVLYTVFRAGSWVNSYIVFYSIVLFLPLLN